MNYVSEEGNGGKRGWDRPIPMPCMNTIGSRFFDVCGRYQYDKCLSGERRVVVRAIGLGGKTVKKLSNDCR